MATRQKLIRTRPVQAPFCQCCGRLPGQPALDCGNSICFRCQSTACQSVTVGALANHDINRSCLQTPNVSPHLLCYTQPPFPHPSSSFPAATPPTRPPFPLSAPIPRRSGSADSAQERVGAEGLEEGHIQRPGGDELKAGEEARGGGAVEPGQQLVQPLAGCARRHRSCSSAATAPSSLRAESTESSCACGSATFKLPCKGWGRGLLRLLVGSNGAGAGKESRLAGTPGRVGRVLLGRQANGNDEGKEGREREDGGREGLQ